MTAIIEPQVLMIAGVDDRYSAKDATSFLTAAKNAQERGIPVIASPDWCVLEQIPDSVRRRYGGIEKNWIFINKWYPEGYQEVFDKVAEKIPGFDNLDEINIRIGGGSFSPAGVWNHLSIKPSEHPERYLVFEHCVPDLCRVVIDYFSDFKDKPRINCIVDPRITDSDKEIDRSSLYRYIGRIDEKNVFLRLPDHSFVEE